MLVQAMGSVIILLITLLLFLLGAGVVAAVGYGLYWLGRALGYPRLGRGLGWLLAAFFVVGAVGFIFEDELFSKADARALLREQQLTLQDDFSIEANKTMSAPGDYYHSFTLRISAADRRRLVAAIAGAPGFEASGESLFDANKIPVSPRRYTGPAVMRNYGTGQGLERELFRPNGEGIMPTYRVVAVASRRNEIGRAHV